jgi:hypothetical protein
MKHLKLFESISEIHNICEKYYIRNYTINNDGSIDVDSDVDLVTEKLTKLPLKFRNVTGYFDCFENRLTTLKGCPISVGDFFNCGSNKLASLEGCPKSVGDNFDCSDNNLTSLEGCPELLLGDFDCQYNKITTFEYLPFSIDGYFHCDINPIFEIWRLFGDYSKIELFNDYDIIQDDVVILDRLNIFLEEIGKPTVTEVKGYKCI